MANGQRTNQILNPQAYRALQQFKYETAQELGLEQSPGYQEFAQTGYGGNLTAKEAGSIGGYMVKKMIAAAEASLANQTGVANAGSTDPRNQPGVQVDKDSIQTSETMANQVPAKQQQF